MMEAHWERDLREMVQGKEYLIRFVRKAYKGQKPPGGQRLVTVLHWEIGRDSHPSSGKKYARMDLIEGGKIDCVVCIRDETDGTVYRVQRYGPKRWTWLMKHDGALEIKARVEWWCGATVMHVNRLQPGREGVH